MKRFAISALAVGIVACASAPRGPSDAEIQAQVDQVLQEAIAAVQRGDAESFLTHFEPRGTMVLRGVTGPDGTVMNVDLVGADQIRPFLQQVGTPPDFGMQVTAFRRDGMEAVQTGQWTVGGDQGGPFSLTWRSTEEGVWRIAIWRFDAG